MLRLRASVNMVTCRNRI